MSIGRIVVDFVANTAGFETDTARAAKALEKRAKEIDRQIAQMGRAVAVAGAAAAAGLAVMVKAAIDSADSLNDLSKASGISVESLSGLGYAAEQSGSDMDSLAVGMKKLSSASYDAAKGNKAAADTFKTLGVNVKNADGSLRSTEEILLDVADVFSQYEDGAAKASLAQDLFGKSGTQLIPFLNQGRDGIKELTDEAKELGVVVSTQTAQAADDFNDNLAKLKASTSGVGLSIASELLPSLVDVTGQIVEFIKQGDGVQRIASAIETAFKLIADIGSRVAETFVDVGAAFGAIAAAAVQAAQGNFRQAYDIIVEANADAAEREQEYTDFRVKLWEEAGKNVVAVAKATDAEVKKTFSFGRGESALQEVKISVAKIETGAMEEYLKQIDEATKTSTDKRISEYYREREELKLLLDQQIIDREEYNKRIEESITDTLGLEEVDINIKKMAVKEAITEISEFQKEAMRNTQDIIGDSIYDAFTGRKSDILSAFTDMINKLVAQALAAQLSEKLFGGDGSGGWIGTATDWLGSVFGGGRANGGPVEAGTLYRINEREPEFFKPDVSGKVIPLSKMVGGGGGAVNQTINVTGTIDSRTSRQIAIDTARQQRIATARFG